MLQETLHRVTVVNVSPAASPQGDWDTETTIDLGETFRVLYARFDGLSGLWTAFAVPLLQPTSPHYNFTSFTKSINLLLILLFITPQKYLVRILF